MGLEIEHKYLVTNSSYRAMAHGKRELIQGYLNREPNCVVRIRIADNQAFLTIKGKNYSGKDDDSLKSTRHEFEYKVPMRDARDMLKMCKGTIINKTRYLVNYAEHLWEIDEFHDTHEGLIIAEIELQSPSEEYMLPEFIGENVTSNPQYYNSNL